MNLAHIVLSFVLPSVTIGVILFIRKLFERQLAPSWRYHLWFFLLAALSLPFLPLRWIEFDRDLAITFQSNADTGNNVLNHDTSNSNWMREFGSSVFRLDISSLVEQLIHVVWLIGVSICILTILVTQRKLIQIAKKANAVDDPKLIQLFSHCSRLLKVRKKVILRQSVSVPAPLIFGLLRTYLILPQKVISTCSEQELKHVILHELHHYKSRHVHWNYVFLLCRSFYWFNPFVWYAFKEMRLDRELACDAAVIQSLKEGERLDYGNTILNFIERAGQPRFGQLPNSIQGSKNHIKKRIAHIASGSRHSKRLIWKSAVIFIALSLFIAMQMPAFSAASSSNEQYSLNGEKVREQDLSAYFDGSDSSFVLYSLKENSYYIHNKEASLQRISPNSTYKIYSALIALETGVISPTESTRAWNGNEYAYAAWNKDQNMQTAMRNSVTWYFQNLDQQAGKQTIKEKLAAYHYGNEDISGGISDYWLESSLKISPFEQVKLLYNLYNNSLGADPENVNAVKASLKLEQTEAAVLYGKTGTGIVNGQSINGWFIGFVESSSDTWFFAANLRGGNATGSRAAEITLEILADKDIYE